MTHDELIAIGEGNYLEAKQLQDGSWAVRAQLLFTRAIMLGVTEDTPYETRYCYDCYLTCQNEFDNLKSKGDVPQGWIAKRPQ